MNSKPPPPRIAPSILSADFACIESEIRRMEDAGADLIHLDVMDGHFVPNITFGPKFVADIRRITKLPLDVHLMIAKPERYINRFIDAGADFITVHYEALVSGQWPVDSGYLFPVGVAVLGDPPEQRRHGQWSVAGGQLFEDGKNKSRTPSPEPRIPNPESRTPNPEALIETLAAIKKAGAKCGVAISPDTPVSALAGILRVCDLALLMSVYPGFGGQKFIEKSIERLAELTAIAKSENPPILIEIDGGITVENAPTIIDAGAEILVAGNTVFSAPDAKAVIRGLRGL